MAGKRAPIFAAIRAGIGPLRAEQVTIIDTALDGIGFPRDTAQPVPEIVVQAGRRIGKAGIDLIKGFEGCGKVRPDGRLDAYPDPGSGNDPWTIGWGSTGRDVRKGTIWTQQEADARFKKDLEVYAAEVREAIGSTPTTQNQFDALVSFHYNTGKIASATLTKKHNARDFAGARAQFALWNKAAGKVLAGLTRRRAAEAALYAKP